MPWLLGFVDVPMKIVNGSPSWAEAGEANAAMSTRHMPTTAATPPVFWAIRSSPCVFSTRGGSYTLGRGITNAPDSAEFGPRHRRTVGVDEPQRRVLPFLRVVHADPAGADDARRLFIARREDE